MGTGEGIGASGSLMAVLLECFQDRHLSPAVPRCCSSNPVLTIFTGKYISGSMFQCPLVNLLAFPSNHSVVMVAHSAIQPLLWGVCLTCLTAEGRTWVLERECKWCGNLKLKGNALKSCNGQPWGEQYILPVRLNLGCYGNYRSHPPFKQRYDCVF